MRLFRSVRAIYAILLASFVFEPAIAQEIPEGLRFFEGRTEMLSSVKVLAKRPYQVRTLGQGVLQPDGSLSLVQRIEEPGQAVHMRRWSIRKTPRGQLAATMSEAVGPVSIEQRGDRYRLRFKLKGGLSAEQWLTPLPRGRSVMSRTTVRKLGMVVARSEGTIRKV